MASEEVAHLFGSTPEGLAQELELLDHPKILLGELKVLADLEAGKVVLHGSKAQLQLLAPEGYPAVPMNTLLVHDTGGSKEASRQQQLLRRVWEEQLAELARDAAERRRGCLQGMCDMFWSACEEDMSEEMEDPASTAPESIDLCEESDSPAPATARHVHMVALNHQHGFAVPLEEFALKPQSLGRFPCCRMPLEHGCCSGRQVEIWADGAQLHARVLGQPMLVGTRWLEPGEQTPVNSGDLLALRLKELVPLMAWRLQVTDGPGHPGCDGAAKLIPLHLADGDFPLAEWCCLGPPPSFQLGDPQLVAERSEACAVIQRKAGAYVLRRQPSRPELTLRVGFEKLLPGSELILQHGALLSLARGSLCGNFSRCGFFIFQDGSSPAGPSLPSLPRLIPSPCREVAVASPNAVTMTVLETAAVSQHWGTREKAPAQPLKQELEDNEPETAVCRLGSKLWDDDDPNPEVSKEGGNTETTGVPSQDAKLESSMASLESSTGEWEAPDSQQSMARLDHWEQQAKDAMQSQETEGAKRSREDTGCEAEESATRRRHL